MTSTPTKMRFRALAIRLALATLVAGEPLAAQASTADQAGFLALILTPAGALPVMVQGPASQRAGRVTVHARYGMYRFPGTDTRFTNIGFGGKLRVADRLDLGATIGSRSCDICEGLRMGSVDADVYLWERRSTDDGGDASLALQLSGGIGRPNEAEFSATSLSAGLPMAVSLRQPWEGTVTLFFAPMLGYGRLQDDAGTVLGGAGSGTATKVVLSAGANLRFDRGVGAHVAVHRILVDDSPTQIGFGLSYSFGRSTTR